MAIRAQTQRHQTATSHVKQRKIVRTLAENRELMQDLTSQTEERKG